VWNDRRLARRAARGDRDAFAAIFRRYQQDLYRYCVALLGDEQDAQDALQNTMVKALGALPGERRQIELRPWLYRVAHNESIELRRRARPTSPLAEELPAPTAGPEQRVADRRRLRDLLADVAALPERHRGALVMRELAGLDFEEIAAALDTSPGAARQVLYEARRSLQQMTDGREMSCDAVTALLSEHDGRVGRRRDIRAHLRDCPECKRFAAGIRSRSETLAGIAPLPAIAAAAIAKGALTGGGAAGTGAAAGGGAGAGTVGGGSAGAMAGGGGAAGTAGGALGTGAAGGAATTAASTGTAGSAGVVASATAKVASTGAILKSTAAIVAVLGVSAVAADHASLFQGGSSPAGGGGNPPAVVGGPGAGAASDGETGHGADAGPGAVPMARSQFKPTGAVEVGLRDPADARMASADHPANGHAWGRANGHAARAGGRGVGAENQGAGSVERGAGGLGRNGAAGPHPAHPQHPAHPVQPAHRSRPAHPARATHAARPAHAPRTAQAAHPGQGARTAHAGQATRTTKPAHSSHAARSNSRPAAHPDHAVHTGKGGGSSKSTGSPQAQRQAGGSASAADTPTDHPEPSSHQVTKEARSTPVEAVTTTEAAAPAAESGEVASADEEDRAGLERK
jgi:RNA polymerase sigma factor (sigma-70 family)